MGKETFYFVDYENVHEAGIVGMNTLSKDSEVHLFYSQNANKLNLDLLRFVKAKVRVHKVKPGKQSLDMQMVSYLGYCIGDEDKEGTFILVSKDTDYANTVLFWQEEGVEVRVQPAILEEKNADGMERALRSVRVTRRGNRGGRRNNASASQPVQEKAPEEAKAAAPVREVKKEKMRDAAKEASAEVRQPEVERAAEKKAPETALPAEPEVVKTEAPVREEKARNSRGGRRRGRPHKEAQDSGKDVPAENGAETVKEEKPAVSEGKEEKPAVPEVKEEKPVKTAPKEESADTPAKKEKEAKAPAVRNNKVPDEPARVTVTVHDVPMVTHAVPQAKPERSPAASRIQAALSEKKVDAAVSRKVQSIVQKHEGEKNSRQAIYSEIRRTFGQKMGVDLYNSVKGLLK